MADGFDRARFAARLGLHRLGQRLIVRERTESTNDDAWEAFASLQDGAAVVALEQTSGRGRAGRRWQHAPGKGLALSVALRLGCDARQAGVMPLAAGLAVARACHALGVRTARLKWPNDVRVGERKLAGVLCELRHGAPARGEMSSASGDAVVIGIGLNVRHAREDFPPDLADHATSLALEGSDASVEDAAAEFLVRLEPLWNELQEGDRGAVLAAWVRGCDHWGRWLRVSTPSGEVEGHAVRLDPDGGLVLRTGDGREIVVIAGDVLSAHGADVA